MSESNVIPMRLIDKARQMLPAELLGLTIVDHKLVIANQEGPAALMGKLMVEMGIPNMPLGEALEKEMRDLTITDVREHGHGSVEDKVIHVVAHTLMKGWCKAVTPREELAKGFALLAMLLNPQAAYTATVGQANNGKLIN